MPANSRSRRAFTLLELLLVLLLMGISAATIVPHLNGTLVRWQLRETARNLEMTLRLASQWARVRQEIVIFALDMKRGAFSLRSVASGQSAAQGMLPASRQSLGQGVELTRAEGFTDRGQEKILLFRPDGGSQAATIVLTGSRSDVSREICWQIVLNDHGVVECRERFADEAEK